MRVSLERIAMKALSLAAAVLLPAIAGSTAHAQFQTIFGGPARDAARGGVLQTTDGGFITAGRASSFGLTFDRYVVKSDRCGNLVWARTYDIGGEEMVRKIRQVDDGSFIIVGSTENTRHCCTRYPAGFSAVNDAYQILSDNNGASGCNETKPSLDIGMPGFFATSLTVNAPLIFTQCDADAEISSNESFEVLCTDCRDAVNQEGREELSRTAPLHDRINTSSASVKVTLIRSTDHPRSGAQK